MLKSVIIIECTLSSFTTVTLLQFNLSVIYFIMFFSFKEFLPLNLECCEYKLSIIFSNLHLSGLGLLLGGNL